MPSSASLCLTPGDPQGIGPEITVRYLQTHATRHPGQRLCIVGSLAALRVAAQMLGLPLPAPSDVLQYEDIAGTLPGEIAYHALRRAVERIAAGDADALVTGPIAKHHLEAAGLPATGHTELLETWARELFPAHPNARAEMLFLHRRLRLLLLTRHIPLADVPSQLATMDIPATLRILIDFLTRQQGLPAPRIALLGVNPHAGEIGGREEAQYLLPAMETLNRAGPAILEGPFPADGYFRGFDAAAPPHDAIMAMYHDQGLIPFKLLAGHAAVNVTIGLPFLRTSVGHGTAFDIAGRGIAEADGLTAAVDAALDLLA